MNIHVISFSALCGGWGATLSAAGYRFDTLGFWVGLAFVLVAYIIGRVAESK